MKNYTSPFKLFNLKKDATDKEIALNKSYHLDRMKHVKSEEEIQIRGTKILKNLAMQLLLDLDDSATRQYHFFIFENKSLLNFMEYGQLNFLKNPQNISFFKEVDFINFIMPFFSYQYGETLIQAIKTGDKKLLDLLATQSLPTIGDFEKKCFESANDYIAITINELKELQGNQKLLHISERELVSYLPSQAIELYNILPSYFATTRNLIAEEAYRLAIVLIDRHGRSDGASAIIKQALKLKLDASVKANLEEMLQTFSFRSKIPSFVWVATAAISFLYLLQYLETIFYPS